MTQIRCTARLRKEMGLKPADLAKTGAAKSILGDWYAHLFFFDRKKCVLFAAEKSLLCFTRLAVTRAELRQLDDLFRDGLFRLLLDEGFASEQATGLFDQCRDVSYAMGVDRSMTGSVTELIRMADHWLYSRGGLKGIDLAELNHDLNTVPMSRTNYERAVPLSMRLLAGASD
ncbi:hypothetical protein Pla175_30060 [Pirellulimonas nuda]|uniref:DUF6933 domain-containing protein n=1 Tax=Pirellulimonas nuda TaxID=2528009 RepID=A0A518DDR9_9BACT|nr:hypothetical protein [Pirellulimonas nuda]QDU89613.1 hypothetical protein Pla175_30060 [Pirellulimonas nuda]